MYKTKIFFLCTISSMNIFGMLAPHTQITTFVKKPNNVACIKRNEVLIGGENGFEVVKVATNESIKMETFEDYMKTFQDYHEQKINDVAVSRSKRQYAVCVPGRIFWYDAQTHTMLGRLRELQSSYITFIPKDFIAYRHEKRVSSLPSNVFNQSNTGFPSEHDNPLSCHPVSCHPAKALILTHNQKSLYIHDTVTTCLENPTKTPISEVRYTPSGNFMIINLGQSLKIVESLKALQQLAQDDNTIDIDGECTAFECYNNSIAAILTNNNMLYFYNFLTKEPLAAINLQDLSAEQIEGAGKKRLSFSSDDQLIVALQDNCFVVPVPAEIK